MATFLKNQPLSRRLVLKGLGTALALPWLDAMVPAVCRATSRYESQQSPQRMLAVCNNLGLLPEKFFPSNAGSDYTLSPYLKILEQHRQNFTVFSGVWHPDVDGGHPADICFLTAAPHPGSGGFRNTISLDQLMAEQIGHHTRFPSLTLGVNVKGGQRSLSWTGAGVLIPCEDSPSTVYKQLFLQGSEEEVAKQIRKLELGKSIMDSVSEQTKSLSKRLGPNDRQRIDQYLSGVRDLEQRLVAAKEWENVPKPKPRVETPVDPKDPKEYMASVKMMYDMACLAFETDSTRLVTLMLDSVSSPAIDVEGIDITDGYHNLSHHGKSAAKLKQLEAIDLEHMKLLNDLFSTLQNSKESHTDLLDRTMVLYGSNLGNANTHVTTNLPVLFAGGGFKHGQHLAFDVQNNYPLPNLFVSMLQKMGLEYDRFSTSTGTMRGLES
jgi:hypothetical protein